MTFEQASSTIAEACKIENFKKWTQADATDRRIEL